jgi:MFS family permease
MLADRVGRRATFTGLMLVVAVPTALVATAWNYHTLLFVTFFLGLAGSSFAVGVGFVSRRYAPKRQAQRWGSTETLRARVSQSYVGRGARFHRAKVAENSRTLWEGYCCNLRRSA